jgi:hypothetical protein
MTDQAHLGSRSVSEAGWQPYTPLGPDDILHFLHIPKTAGVSARAVLENYFDWEVICPGTVLADVYDHPASQLSRWRLFCGHYGRYLRHLLNRKPVEITFFRDPIARSLSHYNDLKTRQDSWLYEFANTHTFEEFVTDPVASTELMNLQTRYLALDDIDRDYFGYSARRDNDLPNLMREYTGPVLLDRALAALDQMAFVGLQERFDESLSLLAATFGWPAPQETPRRNTGQSTVHTADISDRAMERLREITALDQHLYDIAAARFDVTVRALTPVRREVAYAEAMAARPRINRLHLGFERAILGRGWHDRVQGPARLAHCWADPQPRRRPPKLEERDPAGSVHRWTGPGTIASLDLPLEASGPLRLRFRAAAVARDVVDDARVSLNGVPLPLRSWPVADPPTARRVFDVTLPGEVLGRTPFAQIEFHVPRTVVPANEVAGSVDARSLGLCLEWLEIFPIRE